MKLFTKFSLPTAAALAALAITMAANGAIFPVWQDTYSNQGFVNKTTGSAASLLLGPKQTAYIKFSLTNFNYSASAVTGARLIFYFESVMAPGTLDIQANDSDFSETPAAAKIAAPTQFDTNLASVAIDATLKHNFAVVDVTSIVQAWLAGTPNYGIAIIATNGAKATLGSKEGPAGGYPAFLEVDVTAAYSTNEVFPGSVTAASFIGGGASLSNLNAAQLTSGTVPAAELPTNIPYLNSNQVFTGLNRFSTNVGLGTTNLDRPLAVKGFGGNGEWISLQDTNGIDRWHLNNDSNGLNFAQSGVADFRLFLWTNGNVGINNHTPSSPLTVTGNVQMGNNGTNFAASGYENLRIVRGTVSAGGGVVAGGGYTVSHPGTGSYVITFSTAFSAPPSISVTGVEGPAIAGATLNAGQFNIQTTDFSGAPANGDLNFIAIGPP